MHRRCFQTLSGGLLILSSLGVAAAPESNPDLNRIASPSDVAGEEVMKTVRVHLQAFLGRDAKTLQRTYGKRVALMPGHEFLKPEYGLVEPGGRNVGASVERKALVDAVVKNPKQIPPEKMEKLLGKFQFKSMPAKPGDRLTDLADRARKHEGKQPFKIEKGDAVIKVSIPDHPDFLLFQLRRKGDAWTVVSEYID
ncbi:MAG: hypothetical protein AAF492_18715 [Verrucomicrobiota bacterium]